MREIKSIEPGPLSGKPPTERQGPKRRAPMYYAGETFGKRKMGKHSKRPGRRAIAFRPPSTDGRSIQYPDVERHPNGAMPGIRDKAARRLIRGALKRNFSRVEKALNLPRAMKKQASEIARDEGKSTRWARRLFDGELAIHQAANDLATRAQKRAYKRQLKREGKTDAITALVNKMSGGVNL